MNLTPLSQLSLSKAACDAIADSIVEPVIHGEVSALEAAMRLKAVEETAAAARKKIEDAAMREAQMFHHQDRKLLGVAFDVRSTQGAIEWEQDPEIARMQAEIDRRKKAIEGADKAGQTETLIDGEVVPVPPRKPGRTSLYLTFPKN